MYCSTNFKTKKALERAVAAHRPITVCAGAPFDGPPLNGEVFVEGPYYPEPRKWSAVVTLHDGVIVKVI